MRRLMMLFLNLSFAPLLCAEGMDLAIPSSPTEMEKTLEDDAPCKGCGVVTNVRQQAPAPIQELPEDPTYRITFFEATRDAPGDDVDTSGFQVNRNEDLPDGNWLVTVRYDDGSYAAFEQSAQPSVQEGDRIKVDFGKVVPR